MQQLLLRRILPENERTVRDFFRDAREFGPEDVDKFLSSVDRYALSRGKTAMFELTGSDSAVTMELWLESAAGGDTMSRMFRIQREGRAFPIGTKVRVVGQGPYWLSREMSPRIPAHAVKVTAAVMNSDVAAVAEMLRHLRTVLTAKNPEKVREARWDLEQACKGSRIWYADLHDGRRFEIF